MSSVGYAVILVYSTSYALRAEKELERAGIQTKLIPVPRQLGSNCGVCLRISRVDRPAAEEVLGAAGVEIEAIREI
jgi:hypothetical protein